MIYLNEIFPHDWPDTKRWVNPDKKWETSEYPELTTDNLEFLANKLNDAIRKIEELEDRLNESI